MSKPLFVELYAGLHGWGEGAIAEGFQVIGFDIVDMCSELGYERPKGIELVLQDVITLHGSQFKNAAAIVASPPCQAYSYRAMPWKRAKALPPPSNELFEACFRIQREACEATCSCSCWRCTSGGHCVRCDCFGNTGKISRHIPLVVENVRGAQKWVGRAGWHFGSYFLWGDIPALMPIALRVQKFNPDGTSHPSGSWFAIADSKNRGYREGEKGVPHQPTSHWTNPVENGTKQPGISGSRNNGKGCKWFQDGAARHGSKSDTRKAASAQIAKIPFPLAQHIARSFKP